MNKRGGRGMKVMLVTLCGCTRRMEVNDGYNVIACGLGDAGEPGNKHGTPVRFFGRTTEVSGGFTVFVERLDPRLEQP